MITGIHGILEAVRADHVIVRAGGFSMRVFAPASTLNRQREPGEEIDLYTHFQVREDGIALYGFATEEERNAFEQLITVSGIGPKVALSLLSAMDVQTLYRAIADEDQQRLALAPGIGKRTAARLVLELKGKLPAMGLLVGSGSGTAQGGKLQAEVLEALMGLGFSASEAQAAMARIPQDRPMTLEEQITFALRSFARE